MNNLVFSTRNIDDFITDVANEVVKKIEMWKTNPHRIVTLPEADIWFNLPELCNYLPDRPAKATIYGMVSKGLIPNHKTAKKLRFLKAEIDTWLLEGKKRTVTEISEEVDNYLVTKNKTK